MERRLTHYIRILWFKVSRHPRLVETTANILSTVNPLDNSETSPQTPIILLMVWHHLSKTRRETIGCFQALEIRREWTSIATTE